MDRAMHGARDVVVPLLVVASFLLVPSAILLVVLASIVVASPVRRPAARGGNR